MSEMKEIFAHAYEGACATWQTLSDFIESVVKCILICFIYITLPLWFVPYAIYKKIGGAER